MIKIQRALVSVSSKEGLYELCKMLSDNNVDIIATGNTYSFLNDKKIKSTLISKYTGYPEILHGRVKTLNPIIFGGILARKEQNELEEINKLKIDKIDLVCVNLYPFENISKTSDDETLLLDNIDIGGVSLLRAAAKNYRETVALPDPKYYESFITEFKDNNGYITELFSHNMMKRSFYITYNYDANIFSKFSRLNNEEIQFMTFKKAEDLRYGENPHQKGTYWYQEPESEELILGMKQLHGKELSYNNILDSSNGLDLLYEFDNPASVIIKHTNPCGVSEGDDILTAFNQAYECDPVSAYGGVYLFNREIDKTIAEKINSVFVEIVCAPDYSEEVLEILKTKKNIRIFKIINKKENEFDLRSVRNGFLMQNRDNLLNAEIKIKTGSANHLDQKLIKEIEFGVKVAKHVKSNAIIISNNLSTYGICGGQPNRVLSAKIALNHAGKKANNAFLISDGFIPFKDTIETASEYGIKYIVEPGGSVRDDIVIEEAEKRGITLIFTGIRHFTH